jgi:hypothetical protein
MSTPRSTLCCVTHKGGFSRAQNIFLIRMAKRHDEKINATLSNQKIIVLSP